MASVFAYSIISVLLVSITSVLGIFSVLISKKRFQTFLIYIVSFSTGALFGDAFIHLLPEAVKKNGFSLIISVSVLLGIVLFFILEKVIKWRHCHSANCEEHRKKSFAYMNLIGDGLHNFIDGMIIAASYMASIPLGIATTTAVFLHEIPQEMGEFAVLVHGGFSRKKALLLNLLSALIAILGAGLALWLGSFVSNLTDVLIPLAAGGFIYIAGSDLIPELHREMKISKSLLQVLLVGLGILVMVLLLRIG